MILHLSPDATLLLLTFGLLLVSVEFNRPGLILPGAAGLTLSLLAVARLVLLPAPRASAEACLLAAALLLASFRLSPGLWSKGLAGAATLALLSGFFRIVPPASRTPIHVAVAAFCAFLLGAGTSLLTTIAARARQNKGLDLKMSALSSPGASPS